MFTRTPIVKQGKGVVETLNYRSGGFHPVHLRDKFKKDRYQVLHKLGHGGFATVWLARDTARNRYVALKILAAKVSRDCPEVEILRRLKLGPEVQGKAYVMAMLDHFWIDGPNGHHLCVVSEVAGPSIKQFNDCPGQSSGSRRLRAVIARKVALQVTEGLSYIHSTGTVHGGTYHDFTTANILLRLANMDEWSEEEIYERLGKPQIQNLHRSPSKEPNPCTPIYTINAISMKEVDPQWLSDQTMIIDFGIAFLQEQSSIYIGTPKSYCAPEFMFHSPRSVSSDIWALGCTIFEIRTGCQLFAYKGKPTRSQSLMEMVRVLGTLPLKWWDEWEEGREWYALQTKVGGELSDVIQGSLYTRIIDVGINDGLHARTTSTHKDESPSYESGEEHGKGTTSRLIALVEELTTSEAEEVIARTNKTDPEQIVTNEGASSGNSSGNRSGSKPESSSSNAKSGEKSISSEHQEGSSSSNVISSKTEQPENLNVIGDQTTVRRPLESVKELPETLETMEFLETSGTRVTALEAEELENLLRRALMFLPEQRLGPSELAKHHWFLDDFND
ncbi:Dis1-suppressing kinase [Hyphodiscus hymeniophilus]|uniref:Dis1-suppressing kinase n=1 Tax=Hyphodiscus hymeniophilus TaxID=353542 RepID=A0A9P7AYM7_9HELO|nr:Dis1-suppressing kinase [Hyphodiscus hymeniophilus]